MRVCGVIAEFNPFHNGHEYLIRRIRENTDATHIVAVMSECFTQRGEATIIPAAERTEAALAGGVDLVLSLPADFATASAEKFAFGGICVLDACGIADMLAYGSECGSNAVISRVAEAVMSDAFTDKFASKQDDGTAFAAARQQTVRELIGADADILSNPNDILAVEYNKAIMHLNSRIKPIAFARTGAGHDEQGSCGKFASAGEIRRRILTGENFGTFVPEKTSELIKAADKSGRTASYPPDRMMLSSLRRMDVTALAGVEDVREGLENRIYSAVREAVTAEELYAAIKTKRYTMSSIRRICLHAVLGLEVQELPSAIRVLGFNERGAAMLREMKKRASLPVITKPADYEKCGKDVNMQFNNEAASYDYYALLCKTALPCGEMFRFFPKKIFQNQKNH